MIQVANGIASIAWVFGLNISAVLGPPYCIFLTQDEMSDVFSCLFMDFCRRNMPWTDIKQHTHTDTKQLSLSISVSPISSS